MSLDLHACLGVALTRGNIPASRSYHDQPASERSEQPRQPQSTRPSQPAEQAQGRVTKTPDRKRGFFMSIEDDEYWRNFDLDDDSTDDDYYTSCPRCGKADLTFDQDAGEYYQPDSGEVHHCPAVKVSVDDFEGG